MYLADALGHLEGGLLVSESQLVARELSKWRLHQWVLSKDGRSTDELDAGMRHPGGGFSPGGGGTDVTDCGLDAPGRGNAGHASKPGTVCMALHCSYRGGVFGS